ncbi:jg23136 [Pararge aegeria aegeria]|uniref:Jg23136 protein n=2 Tax=Pararge aegeria TaxID=116150 RepID=A0A8S4S800_9NEOP|nr:jg23136 [Pararge aegeria aegeria]
MEGSSIVYTIYGPNTLRRSPPRWPPVRIGELHTPLRTLFRTLTETINFYIIHKNCSIKMWPILMQLLRSNAAYVTLPVAAVVGIIGYNLESLLSDRYTPYNKPVQDQRFERIQDELLKDPTNVEKLKYKENVLGKNVSPSLQKN